jgi:spectinomycin phosphotransferase
VLTEPADLDRAAVTAALERHWGLRAPRLEYLPLGFGSHHWRAVDARGVQRFVTVDDLEAGFQAGPDADAAFAALERAFRTAAALHDEAGLDFVVAPLAGVDGVVIRRLSERYAVTASPLVEGDSSAYGLWESAEDRRLMAGVLGRLHAATERVPAGLPRRESLVLPSRVALVEALHDLDRPWDSGPFAEPARQLLRGGAQEVERSFREYDELAVEVGETSSSWVVTHGEPHRGNVIRGHGGGLHLVDWDTTLVAPRERDLHMVLDEELTGWAEYRAAVGEASLDRQALKLYRVWWHLADLGVFVDLFRRPHERTADTRASWENLVSTLRAPQPA